MTFISLCLKVIEFPKVGMVFSQVSEEELLVRSYLNQAAPPSSFIGNPYRNGKAYYEFPVEPENLYRYSVLRRIIEYTPSTLPKQERVSNSGRKCTAELSQLQETFQTGKVIDTGLEKISILEKDVAKIKEFYGDFILKLMEEADSVLPQWNSKKRKQMIDLAKKEGHAALQYCVLDEFVAEYQQSYPESRTLKLLRYWIEKQYQDTLQENKENRDTGQTVGRIHFSDAENQAYVFIQQRFDKLQKDDLFTALEIAGREKHERVDLERLLWLHQHKRFQERLEWNGYTFLIKASPFIEKPICWPSRYNFTAVVFPPAEFSRLLTSIIRSYFEHTDGGLASVRFKVGEAFLWEEMQRDVPFLVRQSKVELPAGRSEFINDWPEISYQTARLVQRKFGCFHMYAATPFRLIQSYGARLSPQKLHLYQNLMRKYTNTLVEDRYKTIDKERQHYWLFE